MSSEKNWKTSLFNLAGVLQYLGLRVRTTDWPALKLWILNQLPEMTWAGPAKPVFQPTVRAMCAGTMLVKRLCQSAKDGLKVTVTVRPFGQSPALRLAELPGAHAALPEGADPTTVAIWL